MSILLAAASTAKYKGTPSDIKGLNPLGWWDMSDTATISDTGNLTDSVSDKSGNGNTFAQTGALRPSTNTRTVNGLNVLDFDGSTYMDVATLSTAPSQPVTIYTVGGWDVLDSSFNFMYSGTTSSTRNALATDNTNDFISFAGAILSGDAADTVHHVHRVEYDTTSSNHYLDGFLMSSGDIGVENLSGFRIGSDHTGTGTLNGFIGEIIIFDRLLTAEENLIVEDHLNKKWFKQVESLIMIGQSNADGSALTSELSSTLNTFYATKQNDLFIYNKPATRTGNNVAVGDYTDDGEWWNLYTGYNATTKETHQTIGNGSVDTWTPLRHGIELQYGYRFAQEQPSTELRIIKAAVGGSAIEADWGITNADTNKLWHWFKTYVFAPAVKDMVAQGNRPNIKAVYWYQGEGDTTNSTDANAYQARLETLVSRANLELGVKLPRIVICGLTDAYDTANGTIVKTAQATVAALNSNCVHLPTDGTGAYPEYARNGDLIHISSSGFEAMGDDLYNIVYGG